MASLPIHYLYRLCLFNNVAIGARPALEGCERVAIIDIDYSPTYLRVPSYLPIHSLCLFNNVAIGAMHALERCERVAIIDIDAHHGDGTEDIVR